MMILTPGQANQVRGQSTPTAAIEPVLLSDGKYLLGGEVLSDPAHAAHKAFLQGMPKTTYEAVKDKLPKSNHPGSRG